MVSRNGMTGFALNNVGGRVMMRANVPVTEKRLFAMPVRGNMSAVRRKRMVGAICCSTSRSEEEAQMQG